MLRNVWWIGGQGLPAPLFSGLNRKGNVHSRNSLFQQHQGSLKRSISLAYYICATSKTSAGESCCLLLCPAEWAFTTMEQISPLRLERCFGISHGNHMHFHFTITIYSLLIIFKGAYHALRNKLANIEITARNRDDVCHLKSSKWLILLLTCCLLATVCREGGGKDFVHVFSISALGKFSNSSFQAL